MLANNNYYFTVCIDPLFTILDGRVDCITVERIISYIVYINDSESKIT